MFAVENRFASMDEMKIGTTLRDLSVPPSLGQEAYLLAKVKSKDSKRRKKHKRVHCLRNPHVCESCFKVWREDEVTGNEKRLFGPVRDGVLRHRGGCSGLVRPYSQISRNAVVGLATEKVFHRDFFPSMGNLIREDMPDISHHNCVCTGTCCRTDFFPSMGPEPSPMATFDVVISHPTLHGWEEQAHKTCAGCGSAKLCAAGIRRTHDTAGVCAAGEFGRPRVPACEIVGGSERRKRWRACDRAGCNRLLLQMVSGGWEDQLSRRFAGFVWLNSEHSKDWEPTTASRMPRRRCHIPLQGTRQKSQECRSE